MTGVIEEFLGEIDYTSTCCNDVIFVEYEISDNFLFF
ncbi:MAG: hypothetical protein ACI8XV_002983 [Arenicella sp.]|jgi:hypothetical protein